MQNKRLKITGIVALILFLCLGLTGWLLYQNRDRFYPAVKEVTYLQVDLGKDTAEVLGGIRVQNLAPVTFQTDSITYQIKSNGKTLGWGNQLVRQGLPAFSNRVFDVRLFINKDLYKQHLAEQQGQDSLQLDLTMQVYIDPPLLRQLTVNINRSLKTAIPKAPTLQIDSFFVKSFSPDSGYLFQLDLNTGNTSLPDLEIEGLTYRIRLADSIELTGTTAQTFRIKNGKKTVSVPIHAATAELIEMLQVKLGRQKIWPYEATVSALVKAAHPLFKHTEVSVARAGTVDTRKIASGSDQRPTVKQIRSLQLITREQNTFLQAELLVHNPTFLPLFLDSARYLVKHKGQVVARGSGNYEKIFPAYGNQTLPLQLAVNNRQYKQILARPREQNEIPLEVELVLHYNLKGSPPRQIPVTKSIRVPVTEGPSFQFADISIKQLDPEKGAHLLLKLKVKNPGQTRLQLDDLNYRLQLKNDIDLTGRTRQVIAIDTGSSEIEVPVDISGRDVNQLVKGLVQGIETWEYTFSGSATVSTPNSLLHQTEVALQISGVYEIKSKGTPDYMPELSKIDTMAITIRYDTAWVHMYAAIYNTLPATILITELQVDVIHENDTIGKSEEKLNLPLAPNTNSFAWHTLGINYGVWEQHVIHHQHQDSIFLTLPATLYFKLGDLDRQHALTDWSTKIPTPATPVTLLQRMKLRGLSFRSGLKFNAQIAINNANSEGLTVKDIRYTVSLENGVDLSGHLDQTYRIPIGISEVNVPVNLSIPEALKLLKRQLFGPYKIDYKINGTAVVSTGNPKLQDVYVIFENWNQSDLKADKKMTGRP